MLYARASGYVRGKWYRRHRRQGEGRGAPRRSGDPRAGSGARPGQSAAPASAGFARPIEGEPESCRRRIFAALSKQLIPARRRVAGGPRSEAGAGAGRRGDRERLGRCDRGPRGEHPPAQPAQVVLARARAVRGDDHAALGGERRARHGGERAAALQGRGARSGARVHPSAAGRGAEHPPRRGREGDRPRVPEPRLRREDRARGG